MSKLAIKGGEPINKNPMDPGIYVEWPQYNEEESKALGAVLKSGIWGTNGPRVKDFTERYAKYQHSKYGVAVANGTVTMEIALRALGIGYGDEVIVPPYSFYATASCVLMVGATPVFADIESDTMLIDPESIKKAITPKTKAIIPVHLGGRACDMDKIMAIAKEHNLYVIEDAAQAHGSEWDGKRVGSIGHAGSFSFQASKNLCAGEGGFLTTNDQAIYERCWSVHNCGRSLNDSRWHSHYYISTNARMTEWQAAILDTQMNRIDEHIVRRKENADYLISRMKELDCVKALRQDVKITRNSYHIFIFRYIPENCKGLSKEMWIKAMQAEGIPIAGGYMPMYKQPVFDSEELRRITGSKTAYKDLYLENVERASACETIFMRQNTLMTNKKIMDKVVDAIVKIRENVDELL